MQVEPTTMSAGTSVPLSIRRSSEETPTGPSGPDKRPRVELRHSLVRPLDGQGGYGESEAKQPRVSATTLSMRDGKNVEIYVNQDEEEVKLQEPRLLENTSEFPDDLLRAGMQKEMKAMKNFQVYDEVKKADLPEETSREAITTKWVLRWKGDEVRARLARIGMMSTPRHLYIRPFVYFSLSHSAKAGTLLQGMSARPSCMPQSLLPRLPT